MKTILVAILALVSTTAAFALPNPAAVNCKRFGGINSIVNTSRGQSGLCTFSDKSECGDWAFYRNQCSPGDCAKWDSEHNVCAQPIKSK